MEQKIEDTYAVGLALADERARSPFTDDGWFKTGDVLEVDGEYMRFKGRASEIIKVGGEKVYPAELERMLQMMDGVEDVAVTSEPNAITGKIVKAKVKLNGEKSVAEFSKRMRQCCRDRIRSYKIPQKVELVGGGIYGERFKKMRSAQDVLQMRSSSYKLGRRKAEDHSSPGQFGPYEAGVRLALSAYAVPSSVIIAYGLSLHVLLYVTVTAIGVPLAVRVGFSWGDLARGETATAPGVAPQTSQADVQTAPVGGS